MTHPQPGNFLKLTVPGGRVAAITFTHSTVFRIGRAVDHGGCAIRFAPTDEHLRRRISRVHAVARLSGGRAALRDGDGVGPSTNGTLYGDERLSPNHATPIASGGILRLGEVCEVRVLTWLPGTSSDRSADSPQTLPGAIAFVPKPPAVLAPAVWLFKEAGLLANSPPDGLSPCMPSEGEATILHESGGFWLHHSGSDAAAAHGRSAPVALQTGAVQIGASTFRAVVLTLDQTQ